jgi:hypothetical protein
VRVNNLTLLCGLSIQPQTAVTMNVNNNRPFTVAPTNNRSNTSNYRSYEYFDLDDIFEDDFFPPGLDFSDMMLPMEAEPVFNRLDPQLSTNINNGYPSSSSSSAPFPSSSSSVPSSSYASSSLNYPSMGYIPQVKREKREDDGTERSYYPYENNVGGALNKVIMIPPQMPKQQLIYKSNNGSGMYDKKMSSVKVESDGGSGQEAKKVNRALRDSSEDESKVERRERNREHAKRSRIRKRLLLDSLQDQLGAVRNENIKLRRLVADVLPPGITTSRTVQQSEVGVACRCSAKCGDLR